MHYVIDYEILKEYGFEVIVSCFILIGVYFINKFLQKALDKYRLRLGTNYHVTINVIRFLTYATAAIWILQILGFNVSSMVAGLGLASVTVGLAFQDFLKDIFSGVGILYERFYDIGDVIVFNDIEGEVIGFSVKSTKIRSLKDNSIIAISNREITTAQVLSNLFDLDLSLYYEEDVNHINDVLNKTVELIKQLPNIQNAQYLGTNEFQDSAIIYKIRYYCDPKLKYDTKRAVIQLVQKELNDNNISIAYNQMEFINRTQDVHKQ